MDLTEAREMAERLRDELAPYCERIEIAGSVRREKPEGIKDIELVAVPRFRLDEPVQRTLLEDTDTRVQVDVLEEFLSTRVRYADAWGPAYKKMFMPPRWLGRPWALLMPHMPHDPPVRQKPEARQRESHVQVDLFEVVGGVQWGLIYMIRTGSGVGPNGQAYTGFGPAMLRRWKQVSGGGYSEGGCLHTPARQRVETPEEADVFRVCKVRDVPPQERTDAGAVNRYALD